MLFYIGVIDVEHEKPLKVKVSVSLDEDVLEKIRVLAWEEDRPLSSYINLVLREHLRKMK